MAKEREGPTDCDALPLKIQNVEIAFLVCSQCTASSRREKGCMHSAAHHKSVEAFELPRAVRRAGSCVFA